MENERVWIIVDEWSKANEYDEESGKIICGVYDSEELAVKEARTILRKRKKRFKDFDQFLASSFIVYRNTLRNKHYKYVSYKYTAEDLYTCYHSLVIESNPMNKTVVC